MIDRFRRAWNALTSRNLENPNLSLNDPDAWPDEWLHTTDTGLKISHASALEYAPVMQAVSLISGDWAKLPLSVFQRRPDLSPTAHEVAPRHPAHRLVRYRPNDEIGSFKFWRRFGVHALLWGNAYAFVERNAAGQPAALYNLLPDRTHPERVDLPGFSEPQLVYVTEVSAPRGGSRLQVLFPFEVLHVEGVCLDNLAGVDLVRRLRNGWALGLALEKFAAQFFRQGARVGGVLEIPNTFSRTAKDNLEEGFTNKHTGPDNWFKVAILRDGAKFHSTTLSPQEGQAVESGEAVARNVARGFNLPAAKLGLTDAVSYNSLTEANQAYLDSTLSPWLSATADECWLKLLTENERRADSHFFAHDTSRLLQMDSLKRAQTHAIYVRNNVLTADEVRAELNRNPLPAEPDNPDTGGANDQQSDNDGPRPEEAGDRHTLRRLVFAVGQRGRHKAAKGPAAFCEWVDSDLSYHRAEYQQALGSDGAALFDPLVARLRRLTEATAADDLARRADEFFTNFEKGYCNA